MAGVDHSWLPLRASHGGESEPRQVVVSVHWAARFWCQYWCQLAIENRLIWLKTAERENGVSC